VSSGPTNPFGFPLLPDPLIALPPLDLNLTTKTGPLHKLQFVVEFTGPRSIPAPAAVHLLSPDWYQALGQPTMFAMRSADLHWRPLTNSTDGSYDSLALAWDLFTPRGQMSERSAMHLLQTAERFAPFINRRAMSMPLPPDVPAAVKLIRNWKQALDIGFSLSVQGPPQGFKERDLWVLCVRLGLVFGSDGSFEWRDPSAPTPLLGVYPYGETDAFSLANVQAGLHHQGVTIGFSVPLCPAPAQALKAGFYIADIIAREMQGTIFDQDEKRITAKTVKEYEDYLREALGLFSRAGMTTGSTEAIRLFGDT